MLDVVVQRLERFPLAERSSNLLLSALDGDEALTQELDAAPSPGHSGPPRDASGDAPVSEPVGAYLRSLTVTGFRGIGPAATLEVPPGPGLTLVVGRNGSGKSSFAEALEVLLTGTLLRWESAKSVVFRDGWQSKHAGAGTEIRADIQIEGRGNAVVTRSWSQGAGIGDSTVWLQVNVEKRQPGFDGLGWSSDLKTYRPFLSHSELEAFFAEPHKLYDLLASVLGLEDLTTAADRLNTARRQREDAFAAVKKRLDPLLERLRALDDERAATCLAALSRRIWDIPIARETATGGGPPIGHLGALRQLKMLVPPPDSDVSAAVTELLSTSDTLDKVAGTSAEQSRQLAQLLDAALRHHLAHGDGNCPVCGRSAALTAQWREETRQQVDRLHEEARAAEEAVAEAKKASDHALALMTQPPPILAGAIDGIDLVPARSAWLTWAGRPADADLASSDELRALAEHIASSRVGLTKAITTLVARAEAELSRRDGQWVPLAADVASWCADAESAQHANEPVKALKDARKWLVDATSDLRNARLEPLAEQSCEIWGKLRQESNVDLGAFRLAGSANRRSVELDVRVDGTPGTALGVMSQGEINALALSIFLPRATMGESPFRFLVIDDPVQAMDPAKVDGLAKVLAGVATSRQVIVFTHDNRLATAVKDLAIPATTLEVTRRTKSVVEVRRCQGPVEQALKDAADLSKDIRVPEEVARRVIPGLCRTALEAAFTEAFWRQQLREGKTRAAIDEALEGMRGKLADFAALAISGDPRAGGQVLSALNHWGSNAYGDTYMMLKRSAHEPYTGDVQSLIANTKKLISKVEEKLR